MESGWVLMKIPLIGNPYQGRSPIASAQRSVNLYAESNDPAPQAPFEFTQYPTPGSLLFYFCGSSSRVKWYCSRGLPHYNWNCLHCGWSYRLLSFLKRWA